MQPAMDALLGAGLLDEGFTVTGPDSYQGALLLQLR